MKEALTWSRVRMMGDPVTAVCLCWRRDTEGLIVEVGVLEMSLRGTVWAGDPRMSRVDDPEEERPEPEPEAEPKEAEMWSPGAQ